MTNYYLAIDIGASSGRHILGHVEDGRIVLEEMYRFDNKQVHKNGHDCWDMDNLWSGILGGLKACKEADKIPQTIGIDTWAVDFVLIDKDGNPVGDAVAYRDSRTKEADKLVDKIIPAQELYARTGIQKQLFNTIYQLMALKEEHPEELEQAETMRQQVQAATEDNAALEYKIEHSDDPEIMEQVIREEFGYVKPGDKVFYDVNH